MGTLELYVQGQHLPVGLSDGMELLGQLFFQLLKVMLLL